MRHKKRVVPLKREEELTEAEWVQELRHIQNEITHVLDIFNFLEEIDRLGKESQAAFAAFNATPLFWNVLRDCLQESMFMGLGRLCDTSNDAISVKRVLTAAMVHPEFFSEHALRRRLEGRNLRKDLADDLVARAWMPSSRADFQYLKKEVSCHLARIEQTYRPIRDSHYGHRLTQRDIHAMFGKTNRGELGKTLDALYGLPVQLLWLLNNGTRPETGALDLKPHNDKMKGYVRSVVGKVTNCDL